MLVMFRQLLHHFLQHSAQGLVLSFRKLRPDAAAVLVGLLRAMKRDESNRVYAGITCIALLIRLTTERAIDCGLPEGYPATVPALVSEGILPVRFHPPFYHLFDWHVVPGSRGCA